MIYTDEMVVAAHHALLDGFFTFRAKGRDQLGVEEIVVKFLFQGARIRFNQRFIIENHRDINDRGTEDVV